MKKIFISVLLFFVCFGAKAQYYYGVDLYDFDSANTYYSCWGGYMAEPLDSRLFIDTVHYKHNEWQIGKPNKRVFDSAFTYPNAIVTDTSNPVLPNDTSVFVLKIPSDGYPNPFDLIWFSFVYKLDIDSGDIAMLEVSIDSGSRWINVLTDTNMNFTWIYNSHGKPDLSISTSQWDSVTIAPHRLPTPYNDTLLVRFTLITGSDTTARDGWMIDHIATQYPSEDVPQINRAAFQLYPNPANGEVKIELVNALNNGYKLTVLNAVGMRVFADKIPKGGTSYMMQVRNWDAGVYFVELDDGRGSRAVKKLVVE